VQRQLLVVRGSAGATRVTQPCALHFGHCSGTVNVAIIRRFLFNRLSVSITQPINDGKDDRYQAPRIVDALFAR
jgi:hypothetical protein